MGTLSASDVETGYLLNLSVLNPNGSAAAGASVSLLNGAGQQVDRGVTDANGDLLGIAVVTTTYQQSSTNLKNVTTISSGACTVVVNQGGVQESFYIGTLTGDQKDSIHLT